MDLNRLTNEAYNAYVKGKAKPSPMGKNLVWAFLVGGGICLVGQALLDGYASLGLDLTQAKTAVSITLIFVTALLTGIGVFDWCPSPGLPTRWWPRPWSLSRRG